MTIQKVTCPDVGDFENVSVIEVLIKPGDIVVADAPLLTLETDKATIDVPSPAAGVVVEVLVERDSKVSPGAPLVLLKVDAFESSPTEHVSNANAAIIASSTNLAPEVTVAPSTTADREVQLLVLGAGPGGYTAAFRAADLGLEVALVERWPDLGGVCLNVGCIPSKTLLHAAKVIDEANAMAAHGIDFGVPKLDIDKLRGWKKKVVGNLTGGLAALAKQRKVEVVRGTGRFTSPHTVEVEHEGQVRIIRFRQCIIAAGSEPVSLPLLPDDPRIIDSTGALELPEPIGRLLVIGGGIIGLEMATIYQALGAKVTIAEISTQLMPGADSDLVKPLEKRLRVRYERILLATKVTNVDARSEALLVTFEDAKGQQSCFDFDRLLVAVGRVPNGNRINCAAAGISVGERGFIVVDRQMRTNVPHIFAVGDIVGQPMLAHKATHEAKVAAEVAAGGKHAFDARVIPSVAYTDPEVAWVGLTEMTAKTEGRAVEIAVFPWGASGRAMSLGRDEGSTKLLFDPATRRVLGGGIVGPGAGELIAEIALAIEMGADALDLGLTIHPHPTLSETVAMAAEAFEGTLTDLYLPRRAKVR